MTMTKLLFIVVVLFLGILKRLGPMFLDIYTDGKLVMLYSSFVTNFYESDTWPKLFPDDFATVRWPYILDELRSLENWYGMPAQALFYYTLVPFILPFILYITECLPFVFSREDLITVRLSKELHAR